MSQNTLIANNVELFSTDPHVHKSWYLSTTASSPLNIDVQSVWRDYTGKGVTVGVLDSQIDFNHVDLKRAYDESLDYNFDQDTADVQINSKKIEDHHGTMVAGVISAEGGNGEGSVGVSPDATLVGLGVNYSSNSIVEQIIAGIRVGAEVDVLNNSWSFSRNFADNFQRSQNADMGEALQFTAETGRDGLGTAIVFAAGNAGEKGSSNYHNFQNSPYTIAVGGGERDGDPYNATSLGANVLVSGPGVGVFTTMGGNNYIPPTGTSFAAPAVSGVIALMLEANPDLGYRDIQQILALSAERDGLSDDPLHGDGWRTTGTDTFNGGGMHYSDAFGFGFVNAHNAVRLAETWTQQQTAHNRDTVVIEQDVGETMTAGEDDHIQAEIMVDAGMRVEHVRLSMDLKWAKTGDIDAYLTSPDGTQVRLIYDVEGSSGLGSIRDFTYTSVASMGEMAEGIWRIDVYNREPGSTNADGDPLTGSLQDLTLTLHGNADNLEDDVYVYTAEFGMLYSEEEMAGRQTLRDDDGGVDTINAATLTTDTLIDLSGETLSNIAETSLEITTPDTIENAFTGDGDDTLIGNNADNHLFGGRGNDTLTLSEGDDTLDGGNGRDTLVINGLLSDVIGFISDTNVLMLGTFGDALSQVFNIETFVFTDITYSLAEITDFLQTETEPETPPDTPEEPTPPSGEDTEEDTPTEEPTEVADGTPDTEDTEFDTVFYGSEGEDTLRGGSGQDSLSGGEGDDNLNAFNGNDVIDGGGGLDLIKGGAGNDILDGGEDADRLLGGSEEDILIGGNGSDTLDGGSGNDTLQGSSGRDILWGGEGADTFVFDLADTSQDVSTSDVIRDFNADEGDQISIIGVSGSAEVTANFVTKGSDTYLEVDTGSELLRLAKVFGDRVNDVSITENSDGGLLIG